MRIVLIDNFDSFTYNIVQGYQILGHEVHVVRSSVSTSSIVEMEPDLVVIGPGPGNPSQAGISKECVLLGLPIFGICLGHQAIGEVCGARVVKAIYPMHGKTSAIFHTQEGIFAGVPQGFLATRYHSLVLEEVALPLEVTAWTEEGEIMGIRHTHLPIAGVQFHPESIATVSGLILLKNSTSIFHSN